MRILIEMAAFSIENRPQKPAISIEIRSTAGYIYIIHIYIYLLYIYSPEQVQSRGGWICITGYTHKTS